MPLDLKFIGVTTNNGLQRDVKSASIGPLEIVDAILSFDNSLSPQEEWHAKLRMHGDVGSIETSQVLTAEYKDLSTGKVIEGLAIFEPIYARDRCIDLYYPKYPENTEKSELVPLPITWLGPEKEIRITGMVFVRRQERPSAKVPQFS